MSTLLRSMLHAAITATVLVAVIALAEPWASEARPLAQAKQTPRVTPTPSVTRTPTHTPTPIVPPTPSVTPSRA